MPLDGCPLVVEPTWPHAKAFESMGRRKEDDTGGPTVKVRNAFFSSYFRVTIAVYEENGRVRCAPISGTASQARMLLATLDAADAWGIEQESNAVHTLTELVSHRQFKQYMLTGSFLETSKRSRVTYLFRRLRPTIAISTSDPADAKILCALCLHPIAYYEGSWAGAMTPTDDVIAHLALMRGDEHMFWKRANQHPPHRHEAGI